MIMKKATDSEDTVMMTIVMTVMTIIVMIKLLPHDEKSENN